MGFGANIKQYRNEQGLSLRELAAEADMDFTLLSKIEHEIRPAPEVHLIFALADALGIEDEEALEELMRLATESQDNAGKRLTEEQLQKFRGSTSARVFMRHNPKGRNK